MPLELTGWIIGGVLGILFIAIETTLLTCLFRVPLPHNFLVISGRSYTWGGETRGFRIVRKLTHVMPVVEQALEMDGSCRPCRVEVRRAYLQGGVPVIVELFALVRISLDPEVMVDAVERFAGLPADAVARVATETLEGEVRALVSTLDAAGVEDLKFIAELAARSEESFRKLGLEVVHLSLTQLRKEA